MNAFALLGDPCLKQDCSTSPYSVCQVTNGNPACVCPAGCPSLKEPVCGSNKKTFDNECRLRQFSCQNKKLIKVTSQGSCGTFIAM